jgi:DNA-binding CsgD family transcriptional regulator/catechol 2,3-dioxygenase-like lactoylglutathione lyase family enzyme
VRRGEGKSAIGELTFPLMVTRGRGRPPHPDVLTPAEWGVLDLWRHGLGRSVIAERRGISAYAVRYHLRNIAGKLGVDHYSDLRQWPGFAADSLRKENSAMTTQTKLELGPLGQVSMHTRDAAAAERWYKEVLELPHIFTFGDLVFFDCGGTRLYIRQMRGKEEWRPSSILYFLVPDIQAAHEELIRRGVHFTGAPHMIFKDDKTGVEEWMAFFEDPDSNTLAVMARVGPAV